MEDKPVDIELKKGLTLHRMLRDSELSELSVSVHFPDRYDDCDCDVIVM